MVSNARDIISVEYTYCGARASPRSVSVKTDEKKNKKRRNRRRSPRPFIFRPRPFGFFSHSPSSVFVVIGLWPSMRSPLPPPPSRCPTWRRRRNASLFFVVLWFLCLLVRNAYNIFIQSTYTLLRQNGLDLCDNVFWFSRRYLPIFHSDVFYQSGFFPIFFTRRRQRQRQCGGPDADATRPVFFQYYSVPRHCWRKILVDFIQFFLHKNSYVYSTYC